MTPTSILNDITMQTERSTFSNALYIQNSPRSYTDLSIAHLSDEATMPYSLWLCLPVQCLCSWRGGEERFTSNLQGSGSYIQQINPHLGLHASWPIECTNKHSKSIPLQKGVEFSCTRSVPLSCDEATPQSHEMFTHCVLNDEKNQYLMRIYS